MKLALCGDLHFGVAKDSYWVQSYQLEFIKFMTDECKNRGVKTLIQTGDWFDVRRGVTATTLNFVDRKIVQLLDHFDEIHVDVGNHDMQLVDSITPNNVTEQLTKYDKFTVYDEPKTVTFGNVDIDIIPWVCKENKDEIENFIKLTNSEYAVGHFELAGFRYTGGISKGADAAMLENYKQVWSGHYHNQSEGKNVKYIGTPYTLTLGDANEERGFYIFDTETLELEFVKNPVCNHVKVYFNADTFKLSEINQYRNKFVKFVCEKRSSSKQDIDFDKALDALYSVVYDAEKVDDLELDIDEVDDEDQIEVKNTDYYVYKAVDLLEESDKVKQRTTEIFKSLKLEANDIK